MDYYFAIDVEPVANIVDELGGVEVDVEVDVKGNGADLSRGIQLLNGKQALAYIRWRNSANGDIDRIKRQQKFVKAVFDKLKSPGQWTDAAKIVLKYNDNIKTNMTTRQIIALASLGSEIQEQGVTFEMLPGNFGSIDGISYFQG